jgi:hypothetical protein
MARALGATSGFVTICLLVDLNLNHFFDWRTVDDGWHIKCTWGWFIRMGTMMLTDDACWQNMNEGWFILRGLRGEGNI